MPYKNPEDQKAYIKKWKEENREQYITNIMKHTQERRKRNREFANKYKAERGCKLCPENNPVALDFHHPEGVEKDGEPSHVIWRSGWAIERLKKYLDTLEVLCANCHRKLHAV